MNETDQRRRIEEGISSYREKLEGALLTPELATRVATAEAIGRFADGLGDANPLWRSADYAARSCHGGIIAPPGFLNAVSEGQAIVGLPGLIATFVGAEWEWQQVIRAGDAFSVTNRLLPLVDKSPPEAPKKILQSGVISYSNQRSETVGRCRWNLLRTEAGLGGKKSKPPEASRTKGKPQPQPRRYDAEEVARLCDEIRSEPIRGRRPRYFEEVEVGEVVPPMLKGPLSVSDMIAWAIGIGWRRAALAHGPKLTFLQDNPGLAYVDPDSGLPEPIAMSHFEPRAAAKLMGSPLPMDLGFQRVCWLTHPLTNWMGDAGFLGRLSVRLTGFLRFGDLCRVGAVVIGKRIEAGRHWIYLALSCINREGQSIAEGEAGVILPAKSGSYFLPGLSDPQP